MAVSQETQTPDYSIICFGGLAACLRQSLEQSRRHRHEGHGNLLKINPDIMMACAFAAVGILLAAYAAIAFPPWSEVWAW